MCDIVGEPIKHGFHPRIDWKWEKQLWKPYYISFGSYDGNPCFFCENKCHLYHTWRCVNIMSNVKVIWYPPEISHMVCFFNLSFRWIIFPAILTSNFLDVFSTETFISLDDLPIENPRFSSIFSHFFSQEKMAKPRLSPSCIMDGWTAPANIKSNLGQRHRGHGFFTFKSLPWGRAIKRAPMRWY